MFRGPRKAFMPIARPTKKAAQQVGEIGFRLTLAANELLRFSL
jgi:hypothetical protein